MDAGEAFQLSTMEAAAKTRDGFLFSSDQTRGGSERNKETGKRNFLFGDWMGKRRGNWQVSEFPNHAQILQGGNVTSVTGLRQGGRGYG